MTLTIDDLYQRLLDISAACNTILSGLAINGNQVKVSEGLSDITQNLGLVTAGEFRSGVGQPGWGFTGIRIGSPGWTYNNVQYSIIGINDDIFQFGLSNLDGRLYGGGGSVKLGADGLQIIGDGASDQTKQIRFLNENAEGGQVLGGSTFSDYGGGTSQSYWMQALRPANAPWTYSQLVLGVHDYIDTMDMRFNMHSGGVTTLSGGTKFTVGSTMWTKLERSLEVGSHEADPGAGNIAFTGTLYSYKNSADVAVYGFHPLDAPLTSTSWDGDSHSTTAKTLIDLSAVFNVPAGVKAVEVRVNVNDSDSAASDTFLILGPTNTANSGMAFSPYPVNDRVFRSQAIVPCNADGDIYYQVSASGTNTFDVVIQIWGYFL